MEMCTILRRGSPLESDPRPWEGTPEPHSGDSSPPWDSKSARLGVGCVPLTHGAFFLLVGWHSLKFLPSYVVIPFGFPHCITEVGHTPITLSVGYRGEVKPVLWSQLLVEAFAEATAWIPGVQVPGFQAAFSRRRVELLPAHGSQLSVCLLGRSESCIWDHRGLFSNCQVIQGEEVTMNLPQPPYFWSCRGFDSCWGVYFKLRLAHTEKTWEIAAFPHLFPNSLQVWNLLEQFSFWNMKRWKNPASFS